MNLKELEDENKRLKSENEALKVFLDKLIENELKAIFAPNKRFISVNDLAVKIANEYEKNGLNANDLRKKEKAALEKRKRYSSV